MIAKDSRNEFKRINLRSRTIVGNEESFDDFKDNETVQQINELREEYLLRLNKMERQLVMQDDRIEAIMLQIKERNNGTRQEDIDFKLQKLLKDSELKMQDIVVR